MKKYLYYVICILSVLTVFFAGCKDKNAPESFNGNVARPTWTAPGVSDITSSMTAVIKVDLKAQYPETAADWQPSVNDLLAAFSGETCLGVAQPQDGLFFLYIAAPVTGTRITRTSSKPRTLSASSTMTTLAPLPNRSSLPL